MTFFFPWAFAFLGLAPVIVLLYLLKVRRRPVTVSTLIFWRELIEQNQRRALFQRLRNLLSLLLHLLIFLLILLALARPELRRYLFTGASTVLLVDGRARMQAKEDDRSRFEIARDLATRYARHASVLNETAIILARNNPEVVAPFSGDEAFLRNSLDRLQVTDAAGDLEPSLALARDLLRSRKGRSRIILFTCDPPADLPDDVKVIPVGSPQDNVAITRFAARALPASPRTQEILLEISNFSRRKAEGNVEITLDGNLIDVRPYAIAPGQTSQIIFPIAPEMAGTGRGFLKASLDRPDALAVDNTAYVALPAPQPTRVLLVTAGDWFLEKLLESDDLVTFELLKPEEFRPEMAGAFDVVIADKVAPTDLEKGNYLFLGASPFPAPKEVLDQPIVTDLDAQSPILRLVNLENVVFLRSRPVPPPAETGGWRFQTPIRSVDQPLVLTGTRPAPDGREQRIAVFGFDTGDSDLPLRVAFPLLMSNTIQWLAGEVERGPRSALAGDLLTLAENERIVPEPEAGKTPRPEPLRTDTFVPFKNGFYEIRRPDRTTWLAVNTFSQSESNLLTTPAPPSDRTPFLNETSLVPVTAWPVWFYLALAALFLFTLEWFLYHRRKTE